MYCTCVYRGCSFVPSTTQHWLWPQRRQWMCQEQEIGAKKFTWPTFSFLYYFPNVLYFSFIRFPFPMTSFSSCPMSYFLSLTKKFLNIQTKHAYSRSVCSLAGALMAGILQQRDTDSCVRMGLLAARLSLMSRHPIAPTLTVDSVDPIRIQAQDWPKPNFMWID